MIHRELDEYDSVFTQAGFALLQTIEPKDLAVPDAPVKRLNLLFRAK